MLTILIKAFIICVRPLLGPPGCCKFELPCTDYAIMQLNERPLTQALPSIIKRVLSCNPLLSWIGKK